MKRRLVGALLAGGKSSRMGAAKAGVRRADGKTLAEVALQSLAEVCDEVVVLGHGRGCPDDTTRVPDVLPDTGPLGGLLSLLHTRPAADDGGREYLVLPCDLPQLSAAVLRRLVDEAHAAATGAAVFASDEEGRPRPLPLFVTAEKLRSLEARFAEGERRLTAFVASLEPLLLPPSSDDVRALKGANTRLELRALEEERRARVVSVRRFDDDTVRDVDDAVAEEEPLELRVQGTSIAVTMRTPGHDEDLAAGFLITERVVREAADITALRHCSTVPDPEAEENVLDVTLREGVTLDLEALKRNLFASSSCGVCGKATLQSALAVAAPLDDQRQVKAALLYGLPDRLREAQRVFESTGGLHAAALFDGDGALLVVREDVGRHNAVDKVVGWALTNGRLADACVLLVSGRISFEVVQKAAAARVPVVAAISAPTSLAVRLGEAMGLTVVGFLRGRTMNVYCARHRIVL